jgi:G3E family GTPase
MTTQAKSKASAADTTTATENPAPLKLPVPLTVLTGFLGSGKTTLLKRLLNDPAMAGTAVIINEFGDVGLDHSLVEQTDESTMLLPSGCVCCEVRGDLIEALMNLHRRVLHGEIPPLKRVVLETSGLADPTPIAHTIITDEDVARVYQLDGVVTTVDARHGLGQIAREYEPAKQIAMADRIVVTKTDIASKDDTAAVEAQIRALNPAVSIYRAVKGDIDHQRLIGIGAHEPSLSGIDPNVWLGDAKVAHKHDHHHGHHHDHTHHHHHDHAHDHACGPDCDHDHHHHDTPQHLHGVSSFALIYDEPLDAQAMTMALQMVGGAYGEKLLRMKGIVTVKNKTKPFVVHAVQDVFYPVDTLDEWPLGADGKPDMRTRLVFITKDLPEATIRKAIKPFIGEPS